MKSVRLSFVTSMFLVGCVFANETNEKANQGVNTLGQVEIVAQKTPDENEMVHTITKEDIENSNSKDLASALRFSPGIYYQRAYSQRGEPSIYIRGESTPGIFLDGIPVHSIYDKQTDWSQFTTFGLSQILISKGYTSPVYGLNTKNGAVNIVSQKPIKSFEAMLKYGYESPNEHQMAAQIGGRLLEDENLYYQFDVSYVDRDYYKLSHKFEPGGSIPELQPDRNRRNSYYTNTTLKGKIGYELENGDEYSLNVIYQEGEKGGLYSTDGGNWWDWPNYDKTTVYFLGNTHFTDNISLDSRVYYDSFYNKLRMNGRYSLDTSGNLTLGGNAIGNSIYDDYTIGGIFVLNFDISDDKVFKIGTNLRSDNHEEESQDLNGVQNAPLEKISDFTSSLFAEYGQQINDTFRFVVSGSYERNDVTDLENVNYSSSSSAVNNGIVTDKTHIWGYNLQAILYAYVNDITTLHVNVGKKSNLPTQKQRYSQRWGRAVPNANLDPESVINSEVGAQFEFGSSLISVNAFYDYLTDMWVDKSVDNSLCAEGSSCYMTDNVKEGYSYGGELEYRQAMFDNRIFFTGSYSYVQKKTSQEYLDAGGSGSRHKILGVPNSIINANLTLKPIKEVDVIFNVSYQSEFWESDTAEIPSVTLADVRANYRFIDNFQIYVGINNMLDTNYYYSENNYMPGRSFVAGFEYNY
ncbi:TonB-dependent receptor [Campylobacter sp. LR291e]|uniref:TonB-dependent receptor plug domain-containing protein n=1 Tax=unclassified Campylobacter TaxID=2593542 RepID=UPI001237B3DE|nr:MULTISPECIES: TonB-dependent receptor [unclassified Campylobacter]KAA6224872.1 TonB-dependent receptor [Campylobacter sp. LR185c]KAA6226835.1 TonB-dependent receptor [Campylobacter sp. LR196d]KAA6230272.1 TonB-dependent receptor [Campylobacter sp. LR291e]KAA6233793.1 TonB-dependent receptor [Campylobacter sp. LR264d]KAA8604193.1 hypothetical protein CGP82_03115 [Campylobacter sp. LR185c]